ncbi:prolipoprotein diacylglyceryl transferase [bacterium]|nr:prolipoprotein diacylglyceryl transferase [bacterium]
MHPVLIQIGDSFFIGTYGVMVALGLLVAVTLASWRARRRGIAPDRVFDLALVAVIGGLVSARIFFIFLEWETFKTDPMSILLSRTGFVFLGGLIGAVICCIIFLRWRKIPILPMGDIVAPSIAIGHAFGRIGCHFAGCCFGGQCNSPFAIHIEPHTQPNGLPFYNAFEDQLSRGVIPPGAGHSLGIWPVQLMESAGLFLIGFALLWFATRPRRPGQTLALYVIGYALLRFLLEFLRGDAERGLWLGGLLSTSQILSLLMVPIGVGLLWWSHKQPISPHSHPSTAPPLPKEDAAPEPAREDKKPRSRRKRRS